MIVERFTFASVYFLWRGIQTPGFLEAAVKVAASDYLARYGDILSGNYTISRLAAGFTAVTARTKSKVWLHNKNILGKCPFLEEIRPVSSTSYYCTRY